MIIIIVLITMMTQLQKYVCSLNVMATTDNNVDRDDFTMTFTVWNKYIFSLCWDFAQTLLTHLPSRR